VNATQPNDVTLSTITLQTICAQQLAAERPIHHVNPWAGEVHRLDLRIWSSSESCVSKSRELITRESDERGLKCRPTEAVEPRSASW